MTPDISPWESSPDYSYIDDLVSPDIAWEWLRRNRDYRQDYAEYEADPPASETLATDLRQRWGLQFFRPAVPDGGPDDHLLVA